jgi:hypothetical protein
VNIFPHHSEILVSSFSCEEVVRKIAAVTKKIDYLDYREYSLKSYQFNGKIDESRFCLSLVIRRADSFLPLIRGKIEPTQTGCILFLKYTLFPSSIFFLAFWSTITLFMAAYFFLYANQWIYTVACLTACLGNFTFSWFYFKSKLKRSQSLFHQMLDLQEKN